MTIWLLEAGCVLVLAAGLVLAFKPPRHPPGSAARRAGDDPRTYIRRIAGVMLAAFALALGLIVGVFHWS